MRQRHRTENVFHLTKDEYPLVKLQRDYWDDFGYKTLYEATLYLTSSQKRSLGTVKILNLDASDQITRLPTEFRELLANYISLGQDLEYYRILQSLGKEVYEKILSGLHDVVYQKNISLSYENHPGFVNSLLRFSEAEKAYKEASRYFHNEPVIEKKYNFTFSCHLEDAAFDHIATFDFDHNSPLPSRINAIIGKNGTGKTQFLAHFANAISGVSKPATEGNFDPERPAFSKIIAISYSAFDSFKKPPRNPRPEDRTFSYQYCGLQDGEGVLSPHNVEKFKDQLNLIKEKKRFDQWKIIVDMILKDNDFQLEISDFAVNLESLSSGQAIILYIVTNIVAYIEEESLLLFNKPETHLHPNAVASLMKMLYRLLETFNSYAILSTPGLVNVALRPASMRWKKIGMPSWWVEAFLSVPTEVGKMGGEKRQRTPNW